MPILAVAHQKGGVGKSTIAVNLAVMMNADLLDLDAQNSSIIFNNWRAQPIENGGAGKPALHAYTLEEVGCKLPCQEPIQAKFLPKLFEYYNKSKSLLIVDTGGYDYDLTRITLLYADYILSPVGLSAVERFGLESFETILKKAEEAKGRPVKTHVVINNADYRSKKSIRDIQGFVTDNPHHFILLNTILGSRIDFKRVIETGMSIVESDPKGKSAQELLSLESEIRKELR